MALSRKQRSYIFTVVLLGVTIYTILPKKDRVIQNELNGLTMGTIPYNVKVIGSEIDVKNSIDSLLVAFNQSLSTYVPDSEISLFNNTSTLNNPSELFQDVMKESSVVYDKTDGAFDPTIGPLVNVWGFGPDKKVVEPDSSTIDSLLLTIGFEKIEFSELLVTKDLNMTLDFSAIAKGQAVDVVGEWLESRGQENYMVEIGGEVRCRGKNIKGEVWKIGIQDPTSEYEIRRIADIIVDGKSIATSGNYRNYYVKDGKLRAHIVDPTTGFTANHALLSTSVIAENCITADAYATAFMVMGLEESIQIVEADPKLDALFIFQSGDELDAYVSGGITEQVELLLK